MNISKQNVRKIVLILLISVASLLLGTVVLGALNATVGGGKWKIGWRSYRYAESDTATLGGGTVFADVTAVEVDWLVGNVKLVVSEDDAYVSVSETYTDRLPDSALMRWFVRDDGTLVIKNRASGSYFASNLPQKDLTVRIPAKLSAGLQQITVTNEEGDICLDRISPKRLTVTGGISSVQLISCHAEELTAQTDRGSIALLLPDDASFALQCSAPHGELLSDFTLTQVADGYVCGSGGQSIKLSVVYGDIRLKKQ